MTNGETSTTAATDWWRDEVVYQIYPRSFSDSNADGVGDLRGVIERIDHLSTLGVDAVWLSPFYPSPLADGGYDVVDHCDVDPRLGTLDDFDELVTALHGRGLRLIVDIVPNHTSDQHPWFLEALSAPPGSPARDRYHFRDGGGVHDNKPPSDWESLFGGPAWRRVADGQWYLHTFAKEQPDLNWDNPDVRQLFLDVLRFWADRGVDGFRIDTAHLLAKDLPADLPTQAELSAWTGVGNHPTQDRDDLREIYGSWRELFNEYEPPRTAVAEASVPAERVPMYANPDTLGQSFFFDLMLSEYDAQVFKRTIDRCLTVAKQSGSSATWVLNNHDAVRTASRYGTTFHGVDDKGDPLVKYGMDWLLANGDPALCDGRQGLRRARAAALLVLSLPGSAYIYQGEELGLPEVAEILPEQRQDPSYFRNPGADVGRDGCRVPLPWSTEGASFGFGAGGSHLPQPMWFGQYAVGSQLADPSSTLAMYREAIQIRHHLQEERDAFDWVETDHPDVLHLRRGNGWHVLSNFGPLPRALPKLEVRLASSSVSDVLPGETTVWMKDR